MDGIRHIETSTAEAANNTTRRRHCCVVSVRGVAMEYDGNSSFQHVRGQEPENARRHTESEHPNVQTPEHTSIEREQ